MPQISSLEQRLADPHQGQTSVSAFYTKLKTIWNKLDDAYPLRNILVISLEEFRKCKKNKEFYNSL